MYKNSDCSINANNRTYQCQNLAKHSIGVNTPVKVDPIVTVGEVRTACSRPRIFRCPGRNPNCRCASEFVIRQNISVEIPIYYDIETNIGESYVDCK